MHRISSSQKRSTLWILAGLAVLLCAAVSIAHQTTGASYTALLFGPHTGPALASVLIPVQAFSRAQLNVQASPSGADMQAFRAPIYDTQTFVSGTTTQLNFFGAINADKTLSNVKGNGGIMPNNFYHRPLWICLDVLADASIAGASTELGILDDIQKLLFIGRGTATITLGSVAYPPIPLSFLHGSGGAIGVIASTFTAPNSAQVGNNGIQDSGYSIANSFILSPSLPFAVQLNWAATVTLNAGNTPLRFSLDGDWQLPTS